MSDENSVTEGCGNVFEDLGLPDAEMLLVKADLHIQIAAVVRRRKLTQVAAAKLLGIDRPALDRVLRKGPGEFSVDELIRFLMALGQDVEIVVTAPSGRRRVKGRLTVRAA